MRRDNEASSVWWPALLHASHTDALPRYLVNKPSSRYDLRCFTYGVITSHQKIVPVLELLGFHGRWLSGSFEGLNPHRCFSVADIRRPDIRSSDCDIIMFLQKQKHNISILRTKPYDEALERAIDQLRQMLLTSPPHSEETITAPVATKPAVNSKVSPSITATPAVNNKALPSVTPDAVEPR